jgi:AraC-like DNA-binding protein
MSVGSKQRFVIAAMFRQSFDTVASFGHDKAAMYREAGINLDEYPPEYRLDPQLWSDRFWHILTSRIPEHEIAFRIMERFNMGVFGVAGYVIVNSPDFITAFENFERYTTLHTNQYHLHVQNDTKTVRLYFDRMAQPMYADQFNIPMYVLGFTLNILKLMPGKVLPTEVHYEFDTPSSMVEYHALFGNATKFHFNAKRNYMVYDGSLANVPLLNANEQLYTMFDRMATESLQQVNGEGATTLLVKKELSRRIKGQLPAIEQLAADLNMSVRSLQSHLQAENVTFRNLTNEVRRDMAIAHLRTGALNIGEIAFLLGFSEISSFSSAFRKWTGSAPSAYLAG